jgi:hypothetical protein
VLLLAIETRQGTVEATAVGVVVLRRFFGQVLTHALETILGDEDADYAAEIGVTGR